MIRATANSEVETAVPGSAGQPGVELDGAAVLRAWWRIGVAAVVAGQSMVFSLAVNLTPPEGSAYWLVHGVLIAGATVVCALLLPPLAREAWATARARRIAVDQLFLVTLLGAFAASLTATFARTGAVYYEVISILLAIYAAGKTLGARSRAKALRAVDETRERYDLAERLDGSVVAVTALQNGEHVRVRPGRAIGVDGIVRRGRSFVQATTMTGEWRPLARGEGDPVLAGTHAIDGELEIEVTAAGGARRLDAVLETVAAARLAPSALQRQADRLAAAFLPVVLLVATATLVFWAWRATWVVGLFNSMAVLLVACPCALGLATPLAVWQGLGRLADLGLVARTGDVLDVLARVDHVCFDKTGTLSADRLTTLDWRIEPAWRARESWLRGAVAAVERDLDHPIARAFHGPSTAVAHGVRVEPGRGVSASVEGREVRIGAPEWAGVATDTPTADGRGVGVAVDGEPAALVVLGEAWRTGAETVFAELRALGVAAEVLTGDESPAAGAFAGMSWRGGLGPEEKRAAVEALRTAGRVVVFVGDGINDAAAMSAADSAIAMGGGTALAQAASPAVFLGEDLRFLPRAIEEARRVRAGVTANLRFAAAYNSVGMAVAAAGLLHPIVAALLMLGSSAIVSVRALRSGKGVAKSADQKAVS